MPSELDCVFFVDRPPVIGFSDGMFRICFEVGKQTKVEVVMLPSVYLRARRQASEVVAKWHVAQMDKVEPLY